MSSSDKSSTMQPTPRHNLPPCPDAVALRKTLAGSIRYMLHGVDDGSSLDDDAHNSTNNNWPIVGPADKTDELGQVKPSINLRPIQELSNAPFIKALYDNFKTITELYNAPGGSVYKDVSPNNLLFYRLNSGATQGVLHDFKLTMRQSAQIGAQVNQFYQSQRPVVQMLEHGVYNVVLHSVHGPKQGRVIVHINTHDGLTQRGPDYIIMPVVSATKAPFADVSLVNLPLIVKISLSSISSYSRYVAEDDALSLAQLVHLIMKNHPPFIRCHIPPSIAAGRWSGHQANAFATSQKLKPIGDTPPPLDLLVWLKMEPITQVSDGVRTRVFRECFLCHWALWDLGIYHFGVRTENLWSSSWDKAGVLTGFNRVDVRVDEYEPPKSRLTTIPFNGTMQQRRVADEDTFTNDHNTDQMSFALSLLWITSHYNEGAFVPSEAHDGWSQAFDPQLSIEAKLCSLNGAPHLTPSHEEFRPQIEIFCAYARGAAHEQWNQYKARRDGDVSHMTMFTPAELLQTCAWLVMYAPKDPRNLQNEVKRDDNLSPELIETTQRKVNYIMDQVTVTR